MKICYVSGPYRAPTENGIYDNIQRARRLAVRLWSLGYAVLCPHTNTAFMGGVVPDSRFLAGDLSFLERMGPGDIFAQVDGWENSSGAVAEHELAKVLSIPVYRESDLIPPAMERPDYERYGWFVTRETHHMPLENVKWFVVHHEGGEIPEGSSALTVHRYHRSLEWAGIGYHAVIERDGTIHEGRPLWAQGAHAARVGGPNHNPYSWAVCLIGNFDHGLPTAEQLWALPVLLGYWKVLQPKGEVVGHRELPSMISSCPGKLFDLDSLRKQMEGV